MAEPSPRERMVYAAAQSMRERGIAGTSLRDVVDRAHAPRGSLQHYFPGGKDQLVTEALDWSAQYAASVVTDYCARARTPTPGGLFAAMARTWRQEFERRGYARGCPLLAAAADAVGPDPALRTTIKSAFGAWSAPLQQALATMGVPASRQRPLTTLMISTLEGAIVLARTRESTAPLRDVVRELTPLLDAAVP